jgi:hypothetical protein
MHSQFTVCNINRTKRGSRSSRTRNNGLSREKNQVPQITVVGRKPTGVPEKGARQGGGGVWRAQLGSTFLSSQTGSNRNQRRDDGAALRLRVEIYQSPRPHQRTALAHEHVAGSLLEPPPLERIKRQRRHCFADAHMDARVSPCARRPP